MVDLDATSKLGWGVSLWIAVTDADALHAQLVEKGVPILLPLADGPFGRFFAFRDPDGYVITVHTEKPEQATATLDPSSGYLTFINTFSVEPENATAWCRTCRRLPNRFFEINPASSPRISTSVATGERSSITRSGDPRKTMRP